MVNTQILVGRLGKDVEFSTLQSGKSVAKCSLAVSKKYKVNGETKEVTYWFNLEAWDKLAEIFRDWTKKGDLIYVSGETLNEMYEKDGEKKYTSKVRVNEMKMLGSKNDTTQQAQSQSVPSAMQSRNQPDYEDDGDPDPPF